jgi:lysophospholipase L1-like esterase
MKSWSRFLAFITAAACLAIGCGSPGDGMTGGAGMGGRTGTTGSGSGGGAGMPGDGGRDAGAGGAATGGAGGSAAGGVGGGGGGRGGAGGGGMSDAGAGGSTGDAGGAGEAGDAGDALAAFDPCPPSGNPCKILPLGDSITFGIQYPGAYRVELFSKAVGANKKITFVGSQMNGPTTAAGMTFPPSHEGHSGFTIDMMKPFVTSDMQYAPNIILLHIGTNDTYMGDPAGAPARLQSLVDMLLATYPNSLLVVAKIVPYPSQMNNVNTFNATIPSLVNSRAAMGKHILLADLNTGFNVPTMLSSDTIHPNQTGYNFMGDTWYSVIGSYLR